jgi:hypothetical protein
MIADRQDLLDVFIALMRDEYPATVSFVPDSAELAAVLDALRRKPAALPLAGRDRNAASFEV